MSHPLIEKAKEQQPQILSVYWNGQQILRIVNGETVSEESIVFSDGLLTIHFEDSPTPVYYVAVGGAQ